MQVNYAWCLLIFAIAPKIIFFCLSYEFSFLSYILTIDNVPRHTFILTHSCSTHTPCPRMIIENSACLILSNCFYYDKFFREIPRVSGTFFVSLKIVFKEDNKKFGGSFYRLGNPMENRRFARRNDSDPEEVIRSVCDSCKH